MLFFWLVSEKVVFVKSNFGEYAHHIHIKEYRSSDSRAPWCSRYPGILRELKGNWSSWLPKHNG